MIVVAYENASGLVLRGDGGEFQDGEIVVVARVQPETTYRTVERVAIVELSPSGPGYFGVAKGGGLEGWDGQVDYLFRWAGDDPAQQRDSRRILIGGVMHYGMKRPLGEAES